MRGNKGVVGVEEKPSEGYCPLSSLPAMQTGTTWSLQGVLCLCVYRKSVGGVFEISPIFKLCLIRLFKAVTLCSGGAE